MEYETTHPWINFKLNIGSRYEPLWYNLGRACSKIRHLSQSAVAPEVHQRLNHVYLVKGVVGTTSIEGNTLSEEEVSAIVDNKLTLPPSKQYMEQEVTNVVQACNKIVDDTCSAQPPALTPSYIAELNAMLLRGLQLEEGVEPGQTRRYSVLVGRYRGVPAHECDYLLERLCTWLQSEDFAAPSGMRHAMAILQAIVAHLYIAWIHPFGDGNGRTARLVEVFLLLRAGVPVPAAHLLSNFYNKTRQQYYAELDKLSRLIDGVYPSLNAFLSYAVQGLTDGLDEQLKLVTDHHLRVIWEHYIYSLFNTTKGQMTAKRQRDLLLSFGGEEKSIRSFNDLPGDLFHTYYRDRTLRTLTRDLRELCAQNLMAQTAPGHYRPCVEIVRSMLPLRAETAE